MNLFVNILFYAALGALGLLVVSGILVLGGLTLNWLMDIIQKIDNWYIRRTQYLGVTPTVFDFNDMFPTAAMQYNQTNTTACCGLYELYGLEGGPLDSLAAVARQIKHHNFKPMVVFTDNDVNGNGGRLAEYIQTHRLGRVINTRWAYNPNSGNNVRVWVWRINRPRFEAWVAAHIVWRT